VKTIRSFGELKKLSTNWDSLLAQSTENNFFQTWSWTRNWIEAYHCEQKLLCLTAYDSGQLIAIAPLYVDVITFSGLFKLKVLRFLGSGEVCSDHLDFILRRKGAEQAFKSFWDQLFGPLKKKWDMFEYHDIPQDSLAQRLVYGLAQSDDRCIQLEIQAYSVCPYIALPKTWEEYLESLSANQRRALKVSTNLLSERGTLELRFCENEASLEEEIPRLIELNRRSWNQRGQPGSFKSEEFREFHWRLARESLAQGRLFLCSLWLEEQHIGSLYGFQHDDKIYYYVIAVERDSDNRISVGRVLLAQCIEEAIRRGCCEFDLLRGDEDYKYHWTKLYRKNLMMTLYNRKSVTFLYLLLRFIARYSKQVAKAIIKRNPNRD